MKEGRGALAHSSSDGVPAAAERDPLRSTSMPTEPVVDDVPLSDSPLDSQLLEIFFDRVPMGIAIFDTDLRLHRCNKTWTAFFEHYLGVSADHTTPGRHLNELIPGNEQAIRQMADIALAGQVIRQAAQRITIPGTDTYWDVVFAPLFGDGRVVGMVDIVTDATDRVRSFQRLEARIATFSQVAAGMSVDQPLSATLSLVVNAVHQTTEGLACSIVCWDEDGRGPAIAWADTVLGEGFAGAIEEVWNIRGRRPVGVEEYEGTIRRGFRDAALADPSLAPVHPYLTEATPWGDVALLPLVVSGVVVGEVAVYLAPGQDLDDDDRGYLVALADQAAVAVRNSTLYRAAERNAALEERQRLSRELHDSVSQSLFSMTLRARTAQRYLESTDLPSDHPVAIEIEQLHSLAQGALAEMRALIFELRPRTLEAAGLAVALSKQAAAITAREGLTVNVYAPESRLRLDPAVEEHLYRIALEALHNIVRHAGATRVDVGVECTDAGLVLRVRDDGAGFDPSIKRPGHLGLMTMRERAEVIGATFDSDSGPGRGCEITVAVPFTA
ncbi:PAS domain-containing protein [Paeniglutamicibacter antarcticus]|uniref:PAS domain-containing protein n=1 Tax=Arthrobacter terrae TaxID=2935737 RepID=A0A931CNF5_9MICC|nr:histidine kinase [Arthrobacter terrae]MBG0738069.1 PAS domain-containing protein [Arthrobacter terrae]